VYSFVDFLTTTSDPSPLALFSPNFGALFFSATEVKSILTSCLARRMSRQGTTKAGCTFAVTGSDRSDNLREHDVVCEKGRGDHERWSGNKLYRYLINVHKESYNDLTPMERSSIIGQIIGTIKDKCGWFVQHDEQLGRWTELNEEKVRKKVSDDLRREVRRKREKRSNNTVFSAKLKALKDTKEEAGPTQDILKPVNDPRQTDVLFGPGARRHPGNKTYWRLMKLNLDHYIISPYGARSMISRSIVQGIRDQNGRFLEQDPKTAVWYEISDKRAIEKTSHALSNKKYKTRKKNPEEHAPKVASDEDYGFDEFSDCSSDKASAVSQPETPEQPSKAKKMSKKARLLERMGGPVVSSDSENGEDDKQSIHASGTETPADSPVRVVSPPEKSAAASYPPYVEYRNGVKAPVDDRALVSPNDSRSSLSDDSRDEHAEYEESRGYTRIHKRVPPVPMASEYGYRKTEIEPRVIRYEGYAAESYYPSDRVGSYKANNSSVQPTLGRMHEDYGPPFRRGIRLPEAEAEYLSPRDPSVPSPYNLLHSRLSKGRGPPPGYWSEWSASRRMDDYNAWR
jgi:hypothetical protein